MGKPGATRRMIVEIIFLYKVYGRVKSPTKYYENERKKLTNLLFFIAIYEKRIPFNLRFQITWET